jgi:hypothetical protein
MCHPGYAFALWSHKLLRWLSPLFLVTATLCSLANLLLSPSLLTLAMFVPYGLLFGLAAIGKLTLQKIWRVPGAGSAYSFVLANVAFLIGLWRAITGHRIHSYRNA